MIERNIRLLFDGRLIGIERQDAPSMIYLQRVAWLIIQSMGYVIKSVI